MFPVFSVRRVPLLQVGLRKRRSGSLSCSVLGAASPCTRKTAPTWVAQPHGLPGLSSVHLGAGLLELCSAHDHSAQCRTWWRQRLWTLVPGTVLPLY